MQEKTLLKISIMGSLIGLLVLFFMSSMVKIEDSAINELTINDLDKTVKVRGLVTKVNSLEKITLLEVAQHNRMPILIFGTNVSLEIGDEIEIIGKVEEYNGKIELIADRVEKI